MHLVGQLSNPSERLEALLGWLPSKSAQRRREAPGPLRATKRLGNGVIQRAVIKALMAAGRPMGVGEAQVAVEALLGRSVSRDSVNSCLSTGARGARPNFQRVGLGRYRINRAG
jgi:hypothetical protein